MQTDSETWVSITQLATLTGVNKSVASRRVAKLEACGAIQTRPGPAGKKFVPLSAFNRIAAETTDLARAQNGRSGRHAVGEVRAAAAYATFDPAAAAAADPIFSREQARRAAADAQLKELDLAERLGQLLPLDRVQAAMSECGQALARVIDQAPARAEEFVEAIAKDGVAGARALLKRIAREQRDELAKSMTLIFDDDVAEGALADAEAA